jgi:hypothetical protein
MSATAQDHSILSQLDYLDAELAEMMDDPDAADEVVMVENNIDELEIDDDATLAVAAGTSAAHDEKGMDVLSRPYSCLFSSITQHQNSSYMIQTQCRLAQLQSQPKGRGHWALLRRPRRGSFLIRYHQLDQSFPRLVDTGGAGKLEGGIADHRIEL